MKRNESTSMNSRMRLLLGEHASDPRRAAGELTLALKAELREGFEELAGCVLHRGHGYKPGELTFGDPGTNDDEAAFECLHSKVQMGDFVNDRSEGDFERMLALGIGYAFALKAALAESDVRSPLRVIVGADPEPPYPSVTVRYHRVRPEQPWLGEDLERYRNAVMAIDF